MNTFWIFVVTTSCFLQIVSLGFGHMGEVTSSDTKSPEVQGGEDNLTMFRFYKEYYENSLNTLPSSCPSSSFANVIYTIKVFGLEPFQVLCNSDIDGPGWTVIASRSNADLNFFRDWQDYKNGFGNLTGDFFIGLDKLHAITVSQAHELYIHLEDFDGEKRFAKYDEFLIGPETDKYKLVKLGSYNSTMGNSLSYNIGRNFTTLDSDNGSWGGGNCALNTMGAWWYGGCSPSNLFGQYLNRNNKLYTIGMYWATWHGYDYSYKQMRMMVKPKCSCS